MRAGADLVNLQQLQPAAVQQLDGVFPRRVCSSSTSRRYPGIEILIEAAKRNRMAVGFDLQRQLDEIAQLQRLPEGLRRAMGDPVAVVREGQRSARRQSRASFCAISRAVRASAGCARSAPSAQYR